MKYKVLADVVMLIAGTSVALNAILTNNITQLGVGAILIYITTIEMDKWDE